MNSQKLLSDCMDRKKSGLDFLVFEPSTYGLNNYEPFSKLVASWVLAGKLGGKPGYHSGQLLFAEGHQFYYLSWSPKGRRQCLAQINQMAVDATLLFVKRKKGDEL